MPLQTVSGRAATARAANDFGTQTDGGGRDQIASAPKATSLRLSGIRKSYGDTEVLHGVDLDVGEGEFLALVGPSGSGKSTLLKIISGFEAPDTGTVVMEGDDVTLLPAAERPTSMVFQKLALWPHMTVAQNIAFPLKLRGVSRAEQRDRVDEMMALMHLNAAYRDRTPGQLSGGEQQRVALARAMIAQPRILLLDEPLSALDAKLRKNLQGELRSLHRKLGVTFIHVTHDLEEAMVLADRICVMRDGDILQLGTPNEIYYRPADPFVAGFIGETNLIPVELEKPDGGQRAVHCAISNPSKLIVGADQIGPDVGDHACLMVRPEHLQPAERGAGDCLIETEIIEAFSKGSVTQYHAQTAGIPILFEVQGERTPIAREGDRLTLAFRLADAFILREDVS